MQISHNEEENEFLIENKSDLLNTNVNKQNKLLNFNRRIIPITFFPNNQLYPG